MNLIQNLTVDRILGALEVLSIQSVTHILCLKLFYYLLSVPTANTIESKAGMIPEEVPCPTQQRLQNLAEEVACPTQQQIQN